MKRDRDDTDFRRLHESFRHREAGCIFCELPKDRILFEDELFVVIRDGFPVSDLHSLLIPKRHCQEFFDLSQPEVNAFCPLLRQAKQQTLEQNPTVEGFNIGMNSGRVAGQTVFHCQIHLIPCRRGDVEQPRGGVRHVIPGEGEF